MIDKKIYIIDLLMQLVKRDKIRISNSDSNKLGLYKSSSASQSFRKLEEKGLIEREYHSSHGIEERYIKLKEKPKKKYDYIKIIPVDNNIDFWNSIFNKYQIKDKYSELQHIKFMVENEKHTYLAKNKIKYLIIDTKSNYLIGFVDSEFLDQ